MMGRRRQFEGRHGSSTGVAGGSMLADKYFGCKNQMLAPSARQQGRIMAVGQCDVSTSARAVNCASFGGEGRYRGILKWKDESRIPATCHISGKFWVVQWSGRRTVAKEKYACGL
jgi:hypothetical protein